jgi:hypothetical protein
MWAGLVMEASLEERLVGRNHISEVEEYII